MTTNLNIKIKPTIDMFSVEFNHYKKVMRKDKYRRMEPVIQYRYGEFIARIDVYQSSFTFMFIAANSVLFVNYNESFEELYGELEQYIKKNRLKLLTGVPIK